MATEPSSASRKSNGSSQAMTFPFDMAFTKMNGHGFEAATKASQAFIDAAMEINREVVEFASLRFREDILSAQALAASKKPRRAVSHSGGFL